MSDTSAVATEFFEVASGHYSFTHKCSLSPRLYGSPTEHRGIASLHPPSCISTKQPATGFISTKYSIKITSSK